MTFAETRDVEPGEAVVGPLPAGETLKDVRIYATNGLTATMLPALRWLMAYPYGCAEQITSATVPSLLAKELLDPKAGTLGTLSPEQEDMRKNALEFSTAGLARLKTLQNLDGSFVWWPGTGKGDTSMTALVLVLLSSLDDPEAAKTLDAQKSLGWLKAQVPDRASSLGVAITYVEARLKVLGLSPEPGGTLEATLRFQADWFNVFNAQRAVRLDETFLINSGVAGVAPVANPFYGTGTIFQFPSSLRLGVKFQF